MRTIVGPMRCQGCGVLVRWAESCRTEYDADGKARPAWRGMVDGAGRRHVCRAEVKAA